MFSKNKVLRLLCFTLSVYIGGLFGFAIQNVAAQDDVRTIQNFTLRDAVAIGIKTHPEYGLVAASRRATDEELKQGRSLFLPSIDVNADTGVEYSDDPGTRDGADSDDSETLWRYETGVTLRQLLFDGWEAHYEVNRQKARVRSSAFRVKETAELVGLSIVEAYLEVIRQRQLLMIARRNVAEHNEIMKQIQDGINGGRSTFTDAEQIKARLASARANESIIRQALRTAEAEYNRDVGEFPGELMLPEVPFDILADDVDEEVKLVLSHNPTIALSKADIEVAYAEAEKTKSTLYPQVDLQINARHGNDLSGTEGDDTSATALVVMDWNLYRGGADIARAREFIYRHQQSKDERTNVTRSIENDVRATWSSMISAGERAQQFSAQADANVAVVQSYKDQFNLDRRTLLDVLDSQNELFVSRSNTVNAAFLEMFAVYRLLALRGTLMSALGIEHSAESTITAGELWSTAETKKAY